MCCRMYMYCGWIFEFCLCDFCFRSFGFFVVYLYIDLCFVLGWVLGVDPDRGGESGLGFLFASSRAGKVVDFCFVYGFQFVCFEIVFVDHL